MAHRPGIILFCFLFTLYLLTYAPTLHSSDGLAMFSTAESLARRGAWDIEQIRWMGLQQGTFGLDGLLYSRKGLGQPILAFPLTLLGLTVPWFGPMTTTVLFGSIITALTAVLIYSTCHNLGYTKQTGIIAGLIFGTGTIAWPYAKTFFSDPLAGFLLLATLLALIKFRQRRRNRYAFLAGLSLAWAVATRYAEGIFLPAFGLLFLVYLGNSEEDYHVEEDSKPQSREDRQEIKNLNPGGLRDFVISLMDSIVQQRSIKPIVAFALPILAVGLGLMAFNWLRYGNPLNTGYLPEETFSAIWWQGIAGQLISPGRGLLLYSPVLIMAMFGLPHFWQQHRNEMLACLAVIIIHLLLYGKWFMWHGGFAWGPRFMVPTIPFWIILMAPVINQLTERPPWRSAFYGLWAISILVQIPGVAVDFDWWQDALLQTGLPMFAPETFFAPEYSPLIGTWQFIRTVNLDVAWVIEGRVRWLLLGILVANLAVAGWGTWKTLTWLKVGDNSGMSSRQSSESVFGKSRLGASSQDFSLPQPLPLGGESKASPLATRSSRGVEGGRGSQSITKPDPVGSLFKSIKVGQLLARFNLKSTKTPPFGGLGGASNPQQESTSHTLIPLSLIITTAIITTIFLLYQSHATQPTAMTDALAPINQTDFPVIYRDPEIATNLAEAYQGRAAVLGMAGLDGNRLDGFVEQSSAVWSLSDFQDDIEAHLLNQFGIARSETVGNRRLTLFAWPNGQPQSIKTMFDDGVLIESVEISNKLASNRPLAVTLTWQASASPTLDYNIFIHLNDAAGQTVAQADGKPLNWMRPTTTWTPGETLIDPYALWVGEVSPGQYSLIAGLYNPTTGERLLTVSGDHFVQLGTYEIP